LAGFYPDPSVCRVGEDYYLVTSTFAYFPGIPVFHSKDLVNWRVIGHVMDRPEQLNLDGQSVSRGLFAPSIRYHDGKFYVTCTLVDIGGNFVATATSPDGPWSNPVWIPEINGIDPSMFFDDDGKAFVLYNSIPPGDTPLYDGHRTIRMYEFDMQKMKVKGEEFLLVNGGTDITKKPVWIEAPHIFRHNGYYYLIAAEGGTGDNHSEVVFRSSAVGGPYIPYEQNPILTQRHLDAGRPSPITTTGHADFVQTPTGDWWAVFLGCRPYPPTERGYYNTGRETFLAPVRWEGGWPIITAGGELVQYSYPFPLPPSSPAPTPYGGNFKVTYSFDEGRLHPNLVFLRTPHEQWYDLTSHTGSLTMKLRPETCSGSRNPSFLGHRQQHLNGSAATLMEFFPQASNEKAGMLIFQSEAHYYFICKSMEKGVPVVQLFRSVAGDTSGLKMELMASQHLSPNQGARQLRLMIEAREGTYAFLYAPDGEEWVVLKQDVDASFLSTRVAGGFVGCMYALYATSMGAPTSRSASFDWFEYTGNDNVYQEGLGEK
ncbi:MAG: glycoside hydrolase family 43 protein, partial [Bacteroidetes bacterium]|nr:glycoside hydrolase family 43 protein [Bacteroidota bacterium]